MLSTLLKSTAVDAATSVTLSDEDKQQLLDLHNTERAKYGVSALLWDEAIAQHSSEYGLTCVYKQSSADDRVYISQASPVVHGTQKAIYHGENIAGMSNGYTNCENIDSAISTLVNGWNAEIVDYDCHGPFEYSHWTQVVWDETKYLGCAMICGCEADFGFKNNYYLICGYGIGADDAGYRPFPAENCPDDFGSTWSISSGTADVDLSSLNLILSIITTLMSFMVILNYQ